MSVVAKSKEDAELNNDALWGCKAIAAAIGKPHTNTFRMLELGQLPARKVGGQWVASKRKLLNFIAGGDDV